MGYFGRQTGEPRVIHKHNQTSYSFIGRACMFRCCSAVPGVVYDEVGRGALKKGLAIRDTHVSIFIVTHQWFKRSPLLLSSQRLRRFPNRPRRSLAVVGHLRPLPTGATVTREFFTLSPSALPRQFSIFVLAENRHRSGIGSSHQPWNREEKRQAKIAQHSASESKFAQHSASESEINIEAFASTV